MLMVFAQLESPWRNLASVEAGCAGRQVVIGRVCWMRKMHMNVRLAPPRTTVLFNFLYDGVAICQFS
jgi:hypothetical protein